MSGIAKAVKKVWRPIEKLGSKLTNIATFGLHNKWKKTRHKIIKSKAFRIVVAAAAIYFGGAALLSLAGGGTASAGIGSAWAGVQGAGSAAMAGNFSGAASALGSGWSGAAATAGTGGGFAAGQAATAGTIAGNATAAGTAAGAATGAATGAAPSSAALTNTLNTGLMEGVGSAGLSNGALTAGAANTATTAGVTAGSNAAASGGLLSGMWNGLGEAGKAAVITSGVNMAGQMIQGHAAEKAAEEERERRTYWGVDGAGRTAQNQPQVGYLNYASPYPNSTTGYTQPPQWQPKTLDDLINETRNRTNANSGLLWG